MSESKQRWRLIFARDDEARFLSHLDASHLWERAFRRGGIPVATSEGFSPRPRLVFAAPLPLGMLAEHELADLFLAERLTRADLRARLEAGMPRGYRLIDLHDAWVGAPALATQLVAADYRSSLLGVAAASLDRAAGALLAASELKREKRREKKVIAYDLRPLLLDLRVHGADPAAIGESGTVGGAPAVGLWIRLRHSQELGAGRPEEVVAAIADELGLALVSPLGPNEAESEESVERGLVQPIESATGRPALEMVRPVRERLWLADELAL
ncbi:MAG: TIGR03936 family radical SAM-associated protein [Candidatus Limnocylindrales bacterium]